MSIQQRILRFLGYSPKPRVSLQVNQALIKSLQELASQDDHCREEIITNLLSIGLAQRQVDDQYLERWRLLSPREQQIAALVYQNFSNRQIAAHLAISPSTAKTHVRNILCKFEVHDRHQLRQVLADWDYHISPTLS
jgi:DNA-binding NarL/FixJ family response regulator